MSLLPKTARTVARVTATAIAATALLGITSTASAWTVAGAPGSGIFSGTHVGASTITDTTTGVVISCSSANVGGVALNGTGLPGTSLASLTGITATSTCLGPLGLTFTVSTSGARFDAVSYNASTQTTSGVLRNVTVNAPATSPYNVTATGDVAATYVNSTKRFKLLPTGGSLTAIAPTSLMGLVNVGDAIALSAEFAVTPTTIAFTNP